MKNVSFCSGPGCGKQILKYPYAREGHRQFCSGPCHDEWLLTEAPAPSPDSRPTLARVPTLREVGVTVFVLAIIVLLFMLPSP